jgi:hypothetical protein
MKGFWDDSTRLVGKISNIWLVYWDCLYYAVVIASKGRELPSKKLNKLVKKCI